MARNGYKCCFGCEERYIGCHGKCKLYQDEVKISTETKEKERKFKESFNSKMGIKNSKYF